MKQVELISPKIISWTWGKIEIEGFGKFKDVKLFPNGARKWDWNETGTQHSPGIQIEDILELVQKGSKIIILSKGYLGRVKVMSQVEDYLNSKNVTYYKLKTDKAIQKYNSLLNSVQVGGLFHSTC